VLIVTLIGWRVAGIAGALVTTLAFIVPTSLLVFCVFRLWDRVEAAPWRRPVQNGLSAVTVGLVAATGLLLARATDTSWGAVGVTLASAVLFYATKLSPLWFFAAAAAVGAAGWA
jgi:chromate transporter